MPPGRPKKDVLRLNSREAIVVFRLITIFEKAAALANIPYQERVAVRQLGTKVKTTLTPPTPTLSQASRKKASAAKKRRAPSRK